MTDTPPKAQAVFYARPAAMSAQERLRIGAALRSAVGRARLTVSRDGIRWTAGYLEQGARRLGNLSLLERALISI